LFRIVDLYTTFVAGCSVARCTVVEHVVARWDDDRTVVGTWQVDGDHWLITVESLNNQAVRRGIGAGVRQGEDDVTGGQFGGCADEAVLIGDELEHRVAVVGPSLLEHIHLDRRGGPRPVVHASDSGRGHGKYGDANRAACPASLK
jgi:hypothetical protein